MHSLWEAVLDSRMVWVASWVIVLGWLVTWIVLGALSALQGPIARKRARLGLSYFQIRGELGLEADDAIRRTGFSLEAKSYLRDPSGYDGRLLDVQACFSEAGDKYCRTVGASGCGTIIIEVFQGLELAETVEDQRNLVLGLRSALVDAIPAACQGMSASRKKKRTV